MRNIYVVPKRHHEFLIILIFVFIGILFSYIDTYDSYYCISVRKDNHYNVVIPYDKKDIFDEAYLFYENKKYKIYDVSFSDLIYENDNYYYEVSFNTQIALEEEINKIKIINNKQRIISKIKKIMMEE